MSSMRGVLVLVLVGAVAAAAFFLTSGGDADDPVAVGRAEAAETGRDAAEAPALEPAAAAPAPDGATPTRTAATAEAIEAEEDAPAAAATAGGVRVEGRIVDEGGRPVAGAEVRLRPTGIAAFHHDDEVEEALKSTGTRQVTGLDGRFSFEGVKKPGSRSLFVRSDAFADATRDLPDASGTIDLGDVVVELGGVLTGHVVDDAGNPVPDAEVRAWTREASKSVDGLLMLGDIGGANARETVTDGSGFFRIEGLKPGEVTAIASADGYTPQSRKGITVKRGEVTADVRIPVSIGLGIRGVVVDARGRALEGAEVWYSETVIDLSEGAMTGSLAQGRHDTTDGDGQFRLAGLREGAYNLTARKAGYLPKVATAVEAGATDVRIALSPSGVLWGHVRDARSGEPVSDVEIGPRNLPGLELGAFYVAPDLRVLRGEEAAALVGEEASPSLYAVAELPSDRLEIGARAEGYAPFHRGGVDVPSGERVRFDIDLVPEATISGVVLDAGGTPREGASVAVTRQTTSTVDLGGGMRFSRRVAVRRDGGDAEIVEGGVDARVTADADGRFEVRGLAPGDYSLVATHREWAPSEAVSVSLGEDGLEGIEIGLRTGGRLVGTTYDADGNLLVGGTVRLNQAPVGGVPGGRTMVGGGPDLTGTGLDGGGLAATSDESGRYELTGILPGRYFAELKGPAKGGRPGGMIMLSGFGDGPKGTPVTIEEGETATLDLALPPTGSVRGRVSEAGRPLANVPVSLAKSGAMIPGFGGPSTRTDDDGRFLLADVEPGEYEMTVSPKGAARPVERSIEIEARRVAEENVDLPTGVIVGRVTDVDTGDGLPEVVIEVTPADRDEVEAERTTTRAAFVAVRSVSGGGGGGVQSFTFGNEDQTVRTDEDGFYEVRFLEPGDYRVEIREGGVEPQSKDRVRVHPSGRTEGVDFDATRGATLIVRARTRSDEPIQFLRATLTNDVTGDQESQMEFGAPKVTFEGLAPGTYTIELTAGDESGERAVTISSGEEKEVTVDLE
ncbi:MAG: carboxypeptidase regulatory-like domain-containing protein [Planctomycetota bacterium JB042]